MKGRKKITVAIERKRIELAPIRPSAGLRAAYQRKLEGALANMHNSVLYWISARYKRELPTIAMDSIPARELRAAMRKLSRRWLANFDDLAVKLGQYFAQEHADRIDGELDRMLRKAGFTVKFKLTKAQRDVMQAVVAENTTLIKSVATKYLDGVEGAVMRSVATGRDLGTLSKELRENYGVTKRRAGLIARTQNNMASAVLTKVRQTELGITRARWQHSAGGKVPRPEHVAADGKIYDVAKGMFLEGKWTWPGMEINCRCVSIPIIDGLDD